MKLLLDANISWRVCDILAKHFGQCDHVNKIDLPTPATDRQIWEYAKKHDYIIVSKDNDFLQFLEDKGFPPKLVFLKIGNVSSKECEEVLLSAKSAIKDLEQNDYGLLEIIRGK